jgi:PAS domain S-box-containing protein
MSAYDELKAENEVLRRQLAEAEDALYAIRNGQVDAILVDGEKGVQVFSLTGAETIYRLMVETMAEAAIDVAPDGCILFCNERFSRFVAVPNEQLVGRNLVEFIPPEDRENFRALLERCVRQPVMGRVVFYGRDGRRTPVHMNATALNQDGRVSLCLVATDLTELEASAEHVQQLRQQQHLLEQVQARLQRSRQASMNLAEGANAARLISEKAAEALRKSEELYRKILHALPAHIAVVDSQGDIISTNPAWMEFAAANGAAGKPMVSQGANYLEVCRRARDASDANAARALAGIEAVLAGKSEQFTTEYPCHSPQQRRWFLMTVVPLGSKGVDGAVITHLAITERKEAENELRTRNAELTEFNRLMVDRELRMIELKKEINSFCAQVGNPARYDVSEEEPA